MKDMDTGAISVVIGIMCLAIWAGIVFGLKGIINLAAVVSFIAGILFLIVGVYAFLRGANGRP